MVRRMRQEVALLIEPITWLPMSVLKRDVDQLLIKAPPTTQPFGFQTPRGVPTTVSFLTTNSTNFYHPYRPIGCYHFQTSCKKPRQQVFIDRRDVWVDQKRCYKLGMEWKVELTERFILNFLVHRPSWFNLAEGRQIQNSDGQSNRESDRPPSPTDIQVLGKRRTQHWTV